MGHGIVARYALDGTELHTWTFRNICSGIDFDAASHAAYVATSDSNEIVDVQGTVLVSNLSTPTALSFYSESSRLYIADPGRRATFTVDTRSHKPIMTEFLSRPLKSPYGMALILSDRMAVAVYGASSILVFSSKGALLFRLPPND